MKRFAILFATAALFACAVHAEEVKSVNVAGVYTLTVPAAGKFTMVSVQLDPFAPEGGTLEGFLGTDQLRETSKGSTGDKVYLWDAGKSGYDIFVLYNTGSKVEWTTTTFAPSNPTLESGDAMWIKSPPSSVDDLEMSLTGQAVLDGTVVTPLTPGFGMIGYPFSSAIAVNNTKFIEGGAVKTSKGSTGDKIYLWDEANQGYRILVCQDGDDFWSLTSNLGVPVDDVLQVGQGFWYRAVGTGFNWSETNQYLQNL